MPEKKFLDSAYELENGEKTREFYDEWSRSYDREVGENGYATPSRIATALGEFVPDKTVPILDLGCGTGISGAALRAEGFTTIDGSDFSAEMLAEARAKGVYRQLIQADMAQPMPFEDADYPVITAVGVFSPGHAQPDTIDAVMSKLPPQGLFAFSLNDHALENPGYKGRIMDHLDCGAASLLFKEYGAHLPKIGLKACVYVMRKR